MLPIDLSGKMSPRPKAIFKLGDSIVVSSLQLLTPPNQAFGPGLWLQGSCGLSHGASSWPGHSHFRLTSGCLESLMAGQLLLSDIAIHHHYHYLL